MKRTWCFCAIFFRMRLMDKRNLLKTVLLIISLAVVPAVFLPADADLNIYYTASLNGNLLGCECKGVPKAGLTVTAAYLRDLDHSDSILLDLGDFSDARIDKLLSNTLLEIYSDLGYDAAALGDQELGSGVDFFKQSSKKLDFLCNNISIDGKMLSPEPMVIEKNGYRIGIAAVIDPSVFFFYPNEVKERLSISDPSEAAAGALDKLEARGTHFNILLYHGHIDGGAKELYASQSGWGAVLAAHDQMLFEDSEDGRRVLVSPGEEGNRVGHIAVDFRFKKAVSVENSFRYFKYEVDPEDPEVVQAFEDYKKKLIENLKNGKQ